MIRITVMLRRALYIGIGIVVVLAVLSGLAAVNEQMLVRYQAVGQVVDEERQPLEGVEVVLLLTPPPAAREKLDALFHEEAKANRHYGPNGALKRAVGPAIGLSANTGYFIARTVGRLGAAHAIRMGFDSGGRPPFERAWLLLRKDGYQDETRTVSILGWKKVPDGWGTHASTLPVTILSKEGLP